MQPLQKKSSFRFFPIFWLYFCVGCCYWNLSGVYFLVLCWWVNCVCITSIVTLYYLYVRVCVLWSNWILFFFLLIGVIKFFLLYLSINFVYNGIKK